MAWRDLEYYGSLTVSEENRSGAGAPDNQSNQSNQAAGKDAMQEMIDRRMARFKEIAKYIAAGAAAYILFMVWYMMHQ